MILPRLLVSTFAAAAAVALAQSSPPPAAGAPATKLRYESTFSDYQPYAESDVISWKQANNDAAGVGGHMGQMKHGAMPAMMPKATAPMAKSPTSGSPAAPVPAGNPGHAR